MTNEANFHSRPPLGLPTGSVRALLTLVILAIVAHEIVLGREVAIVWVETLVIALAYYFTYRRFVALPPQLLARLEQEGAIPKEPNPLGLPRHSIRIAIVLTISALAVYLYREKRLHEPQVVTILGTTICYLVGVLIRGITHWWWRGRTTLGSHLWEDTKAVAVLAAVIGTAVMTFVGGPALVPHWLETTTVGFALFYFGSR